MLVTKIEPNWMHGYGNKPEIVVTVDEALPHDRFIYNVERPNTFAKGNKPGGMVRNVMLVSTNQAPWVRFVFVDNPEGDPSYYGALGGTYTLVDGSTFETRTGWSSRCSVVNSKYANLLRHSGSVPEHVTEVTVAVPRPNSPHPHAKPSLWAGYYLEVNYLRNHPLWPKDCYLVCTVRDDGEINYNINADPVRVVKARNVG